MSKDSTTLYLFVNQKNKSDIIIKGLNNKIKSVSLLNTNEMLHPKIVGKIWWSQVPGLVFIPASVKISNNYFDVVKIELEGKLSLYAAKK